jgi:hypothetical protein
VRVEIVAVGAEDVAATVAGIGDLDLDSRQAPLDRLLDRTEEEVEEVAEEDQLVDPLQRRCQPLEEELLTQQVPPGPGAEVGVGDDQGALRPARV